MTNPNQFDLDAWAAGLVFPDAGSVQAGSASGEVGEHLPGERIEAIIAGGSLKNTAEVAEIGLAGSGQAKHQMAQDLLRDVKRLKALVIHIESSLVKFASVAEAVE